MKLSVVCALLILKVISTVGNLEHHYIGCYARTDENGDGGTEVSDSGDNMSIEYCRNLCFPLNTTFAALTNESTCVCVNYIFDSLPESNCQLRCSNKTANEYCGGIWSYSVYSVCPIGLYGPNCAKRCCNNTRLGSTLCHRSSGECFDECHNNTNSISCNIHLKSSTGNIALRRTAIQSSTYLNQTAADLAVDGNKNKYSRTDCKKAPDEWLAVDLGGRYNISHVVVTNRRDCCDDRLDNFIVGVTNTAPNNNKALRGTYPLCGQYNGRSRGHRTLSVNCSDDSPAGRYVVIQQNSTGYPSLTVCELEIYTTNYRNLNIARNKTAFQSSTAWGGVASRAVDGNKNTTWRGGSCTHTGSRYTTNDEWLYVDLGYNFNIQSVVVHGGNNTSTFTVGVTKTRPRNDTWNRGSYSVCGENFQPSNEDRSVTANCSVDIPAGRYVIVQQNARGDEGVSISEMEIYTYDCKHRTGYICGDNEECITVDLLFSRINRCDCKDGFYRNKIWNRCEDINECLHGADDCDRVSTVCINTIGSYSCKCEEGYGNITGVNNSCTDIDECSTNTYSCDNATTLCRNTNGSYECDCREEHSRINETTCADIDECANNTHTCHHATTLCRNTIGSYECDCRGGHQRINDATCEDIDECARYDNVCNDTKMACSNTPGNYICATKKDPIPQTGVVFLEKHVYWISCVLILVCFIAYVVWNRRKLRELESTRRPITAALDCSQGKTGEDDARAVYDTIPDIVDKDGNYLKLEERKFNTADVVYEDMQPKSCDVVCEGSSSIDNCLKFQGREEHTGNLYEDIQTNLNTYSNT